MLKRLTLGLLLVLILAPAAAQQNWNAKWISHPDISPQEHTVVHFRTAFELAAVPDSFPVSISADNHFRLYVNGEFVAFGPQLGEVTHWHYDDYDLARYLRPGNNVLAVQVTNWGHFRMFGMQSVHTGLIVQGRGAAEIVTTRGYDERWKSRVNKGITGHEVKWRVRDPDIIGGLYANNPTDSLHAERYPWNWERTDYDDFNWAAATFLENGQLAGNGGGFLWLLEPRTTPHQATRHQAFRALRQSNAPAGPKGWWLGTQATTLPANGSYRLLLDMEEVTFGFPELRWSGGKGSRMKYTWAENLFLADKNKTDRDRVDGMLVKGYFDVMTADGGKDRRYVPTWYRAFRYLEIQVETAGEPLELFAPVTQRVTSSIPIVAEWESDDEMLDAAFDISRRTVEICTQDYFLSDAYYETMQYIGDTKVHALAWQALTGDLRHTRNALQDFHRSRNEDGVLKSCYPLRYNFYHSSYSLIYVDMVWDYLQRSGDTLFVRGLLPGIRQTMDFFDTKLDRESGYLGDMSFKPFVDWYVESKRGGIAPGADKTRSVPITLQYAHALRSAESLYRALGVDSAKATAWQETRESIVPKLRSSAYNADRKLLAERPDRSYYDQHSTILGVLLDVVPKADQAAAVEALLNAEGLGQATYYFRYYLHRSLLKTERTDLVKTALQPWYKIVEQGATTVVERFEGGKPTRSEAHPWGASPVLFAYANLAGIELDRNSEVITMEPRFGHLRRMEGFCPVFGPDDGVGFELERVGETGVRGTVRAGNTPVKFVVGKQVVEVAAGKEVLVDLRE